MRIGSDFQGGCKMRLYKIILYAVVIALLVWLVVSVGEVMLHNMEHGYIYSRFNFFNIFT